VALLDDLGAHLQTQGVGTLATDLFVGDMPPSPAAAGTVYETPGSPPLDVGGVAGDPAVQRPRVQVVCRAVTYQAARSKARDAYDALHAVANQNVNGVYYERVAALQEPFLLRRDESERVLVAFNCEVWRSPE